MFLFGNYHIGQLVLLTNEMEISELSGVGVSLLVLPVYLLQEPQHCILDIDDEVVLNVFKHLYSDGKYSIDDIIDGEDCVRLCKM